MDSIPVPNGPPPSEISKSKSKYKNIILLPPRFPPPDHPPPPPPENNMSEDPIPRDDLTISPFNHPLILKEVIEGLLSRKARTTWGFENFYSFSAITSILSAYKGKEKNDQVEEFEIGKNDTIKALDPSIKKFAFEIKISNKNVTLTLAASKYSDATAWMDTIESSIKKAMGSESATNNVASKDMNDSIKVETIDSPTTIGEEISSSPPEPFINPFDTQGGISFNPLEFAMMQKKEKKAKKKDGKGEKAKVTKIMKVEKEEEQEIDDIKVMESKSLNSGKIIIEEGEAPESPKSLSKIASIRSIKKTVSPTLLELDTIDQHIATALYPFNADPNYADVQLSLAEGQKVLVLEEFHDGWTKVKNLETNREGKVPSTYISTVITKEEAKALVINNIEERVEETSNVSPKGHKTLHEAGFIDGRKLKIIHQFVADPLYDALVNTDVSISDSQLNVMENEIVTCIEVFEDGWTKVQNDSKQIGHVPTTYINFDYEKEIKVEKPATATNRSSKLSEILKKKKNAEKELTIITKKNEETTSIKNEEIVSTKNEDKSPIVPLAQISTRKRGLSDSFSVSKAEVELLPEVIVDRALPQKGKRASFFGNLPNLNSAVNKAVQRISIVESNPIIKEEDESNKAVEGKENNKNKNIQNWRKQKRKKILNAVEKDTRIVGTLEEIYMHDINDASGKNDKKEKIGQDLTFDQPTSEASLIENIIQLLLSNHQVIDNIENFDEDEDNLDDTSSSLYISNSQKVINRNEKTLRELRARTMAEFFQKLLKNKEDLLSLFNKLSENEKKEMGNIENEIKKIENKRNELRKDQEILNKAKDETENWHITRMKELATIASKLQERNETGKQTLNLMSPSNRESRLETLKKRTNQLQMLLENKEKELKELQTKK